MQKKYKLLQRVAAWCFLGAIEILSGMMAGALAAAWLIPVAYRERGYAAVGGEWLLIIIAAGFAVYAMHAVLMRQIFGGQRHGRKMHKVSQSSKNARCNASQIRSEVLPNGVRKASSRAGA